jgi:pyruvate/2-oxoglutarate dehydrogenase complex dihydrolipoamide dehydrogenase (E3) component
MNPILKPWDAHNQRLAANVHPADWVNPAPAERYNLVVIGAGTAGLICSSIAAGLGAKVALVERHLMGGDCLNVGCVPSKALLRAARAVAEVRRAGEFGVRVPEGVSVDFPAIMERMRRLRADISPHDSAQRYRDMGIDVFIGEAKFASPESVEVSGKSLRFAKAVIATGARAAAPPIPGLADVPYLTNESVFSLTELPRRLGVIGAGPIGCELAQAFARFGSEVFLVEAGHGVLPREDRDAARFVQQALEHDGVKLLCCGRELQLAKSAEGVRLTVESHGESYDVTVDQLLVSAGRRPNVEGLNLEGAGVRFSRTGVEVDDFLQTTNPRIYAAGDICLPHKFTHTADASAQIVVQNALFAVGPLLRRRVSKLTIPWCTYTDPEIAHVGMNEKDAKELGIPVQTFTQELSAVDRALLDGETGGLVKLHVRAGTDEILGGTIVASHAGEMISELTLAMTAGLGLKSIGGTIHPYPTQAEALKRAANGYTRSRLTPGVKRWLERWLRWRR